MHSVTTLGGTAGLFPPLVECSAAATAFADYVQVSFRLYSRYLDDRMHPSLDDGFFDAACTCSCNSRFTDGNCLFSLGRQLGQLGSSWVLSRLHLKALAKFQAGTLLPLMNGR